MKILLVRTSALGDVVHCLPVLNALRRQLPDARLAWVVEGAMAKVVEDHPHLDRVIVARLRPWRRTPWTSRAAVAGFLRELRSFGADVALDLMGNFKGAALARLSGARLRVGLAGPHRREPASGWMLNRAVPPLGEHAVERALSLLPALGLDPGLNAVDFGGELLFPDARPEAFPGNGHVLIQPGAGWANKIYPPESWGEVARLLRAETGIPSRVAVAPGEEDLARRVVAASGGAAVAEPSFGLDALAVQLRAARLVVGGDTGPIHLAHALGVPVLCLMGPTNPARHGPHDAPDRALAVRLPCSYCYKRFDGPRACLLTWTPEAIAERAIAVLS